MKKIISILSLLFLLSSCSFEINFNKNDKEDEQKTTYFINYYIDKELFSTAKGEINESISLLVPTKDGYTFNGWFKDIEYNGSSLSTLTLSDLPDNEEYNLYGYYTETVIPVSENVEKVINKIKSLPNYNEISENNINEINSLYNSLSEKDKSYVNNYDIFNNAIEAYNNYKKIDYNSIEAKQLAIANAAMAFSDKLTNFQYDQYTYRRNVNCTPEDGNDYLFTYLDCSGFCNSVYQYVFNDNIIKGVDSVSTATVESYCSSNYLISDDVIYFANLSKETKTDERAKEIKAMLEPGDLYCYRHGSSGHIMLYIGNNTFVHSTGSAGLTTANAISTGPYNRTSEDQTTHEKNYGTICVDSADIVFDKSQATNGVGGSTNRYIFNSSNTSAMILRPLVRNLSLSKEGIDRINYPRLEIKKSNNINNFSSIINGDYIEYYIDIKNNGEKVKYINITENLPLNCEYVESNGRYSDGKINFKVSYLNQNSSITLRYKVKVNGEIGSRIQSFNTYVNNLRTNMIENDIKKELNYKNLTVDLTKNYISGSEFAIDTYNKIDINLSKYFTKDEEIVDKYYDKNGNILENNISELIPAVHKGGIYPRRVNTTDNDQLNNLKSSYLENGDIISCEFNKNYEVYIYLNDILYNYKDGKINQISGTNIDKTLHTIPYYYRYIIIRSSLIK